MNVFTTTIGATLMTLFIILALLLGLGVGVQGSKEKIRRDCDKSGRIVISEGIAYTCAPEKRP